MCRAADEKQITQRTQPQSQNHTPGIFLPSSKNERFFALCMDKQLEM